MPPELPPTYYLDNVVTLLDQVESLYADILDDELREFLQVFGELGDDARKLYIRLLNRSANCYRVARLDYPEIESLAAAIDELAAAGCLDAEPTLEVDELLKLYTKPELVAAAAEPGLSCLDRASLEALLTEYGDSGFLDALRTREPLLRVNNRDAYLQCQMLFFGNSNQSMTDFVLRDLGLYRYERYRIDGEFRPYRSALEIQHHWLLLQLAALIGQVELDDAALVAELFDAIPPDIDPDAPAWRKAERLRCELARQLERLGELDAALARYRQCTLPPAREREARVLAQLGEIDAALAHCDEILAAPRDETELQFAAAFATRLGKKHAIEPPAAVADAAVGHAPAIDNLELDYADSVELATAAHYNAADDAETCYYVENSLFTGVLGLLLWDVVFAPVAGAFFNPFQSRPSDFYAADFCARRAPLLRRLWSGVRDNDDLRRVVLERYEQKHGILNPLVHWQALEPALIERALERIEHAHWRAIFDRILADLRHNRAGFPDLLHLPPAGGYCLIEVKGPGDTLQKNQQGWLDYFHIHGIPHRLARVTWRDR